MSEVTRENVLLFSQVEYVPPGNEHKAHPPPVIANGRLYNGGKFVCLLTSDQANYLDDIIHDLSGRDFLGMAHRLASFDELYKGHGMRHFLLDLLMAFFKRLDDRGAVMSREEARLVQMYLAQDEPLRGLRYVGLTHNELVRANVDWLIDKVIDFEPLASETAEALAFLHTDVVLGHKHSDEPHTVVRRHENAFKMGYTYMAPYRTIDLFEPIVFV